VYGRSLNSASMLNRAFRVPREVAQNIAAPAPAALMRGRHWGGHVLCFHMYAAPPKAPRRPRKARFKTKALLIDHTYVHTTSARNEQISSETLRGIRRIRSVRVPAGVPRPLQIHQDHSTLSSGGETTFWNQLLTRFVTGSTNIIDPPLNPRTSYLKGKGFDVWFRKTSPTTSNTRHRRAPRR
jgi:hypothetical protein